MLFSDPSNAALLLRILLFKRRRSKSFPILLIVFCSFKFNKLKLLVGTIEKAENLEKEEEIKKLLI